MPTLEERLHEAEVKKLLPGWLNSKQRMELEMEGAKIIMEWNEYRNRVLRLTIEHLTEQLNEAEAKKPQ